MVDEKYYAHSSESDDRSTWQPLAEHLANVGDLAASFAEPFGCSEWANAAGILHDLGKATEEFQRRLQGSFPPFDHSIAGAYAAERTDHFNTRGMNEGSYLATIVAGHHTGLQDSLDVRFAAYERGDIPLAKSIDQIGVTLPEASNSVWNHLVAACEGRKEVGTELISCGMFVLSHLIFSSLVDADWLDTERFMSAENYARRDAAITSHESLAVLSNRLDKYLSKFKQDSPVNEARAVLLNETQMASSLPPGIFELSIPTGGGKTLTSLSFALRNALSNNQQRVVYAIPFMSIVEQTARVFRDVLGSHNIIEHVSSYDYALGSGASYRAENQDFEESVSVRRELGLREKMLTQNWDAPIVVTTNVQLFESLFSNKVSKSRKVHNIANSVIVLDEVQSLPDSLLKPTLAMLESLVAVANVSVVLCTATQPALDNQWPLKSKPVKLISNPERFDSVFGNRVSFDCTHAFEDCAYELDELVKELTSCRQALCIVSSRKAARIVYDEMKCRNNFDEDLFHLSALMVPEHRTRVIDEIKARLSENRPCRVVSTQLVEAGVDLDFPVVFREVAGTDSMLQAAGRCNREGKLPSTGRVVIFDCSAFAAIRSKKPNWLGKMRALGVETLYHSISTGVDPFGAEAVEQFFNRRHQTSETDGEGNKPIYGLIVKKDTSHFCNSVQLGHFMHETIANRYRFIADDTIAVFVPWGSEGETLLQLIEEDEFSSEMFPRIQRFTISIKNYLFEQYDRAGTIRHIAGFPVPVLETGDGMKCLYDDERGLLGFGEEKLDVLVV